ncbi:MAG: hypothetical protein ABI867_34315 [Kofleriaceae bacterium]
MAKPDDKFAERRTRSTAEGGAKVIDKNDSTMEVSTSQLVPDAGIPKNDRSVWKQVVVSSDDFAAPAKPAKPANPRRWWIFAVIGLVAVAGGIVAWIAMSGDNVVITPTPPPPKPAAIVPPVDARPIDAPPDAAIDAPVDAAVDAPVDAAPIAKPVPKRKPVVKKAPPKKKPVPKRR